MPAKNLKLTKLLKQAYLNNWKQDTNKELNKSSNKKRPRTHQNQHNDNYEKYQHHHNESRLWKAWQTLDPKNKRVANRQINDIKKEREELRSERQAAL